MADKTTTTDAKTATVQNEGEAPVVLGTASALDTSGAADLPAATEFSPSGAPRQVTEFPVEHPAVDNNPREGTTVDQNRIDFNDPTKPGAEVVAEQLGMKAPDEKAKA